MTSRHTLRRLPLYLLVAAACSTFVACGGGGGDGSGNTGGNGSSSGGGGTDTGTPATTQLPAVGPISGAEFDALEAPTVEQFMKAYETVTGVNPGLLNDEAALARAVFDEVKRTTAVASKSSAALSKSLFDKATKLTREEWKLVMLHPLDSYRAAGTVDVSLNTAASEMPCDADVGFTDGKADALRHAYWNALMSKRTSGSFAEAFGTAHESGNTNADSAKAMDLHNNAIGRALTVKYPTATEAQLLELLLQQSFTYVPTGTAIPAGTQGLVYISEVAKRPFDGTYTGSFTNPDSGGPWSAVFNLSQCGAVVRGNFRIVRGQAFQERRFTGTATGETTIQLAISNPYAFENPDNNPACVGMNTNLNGSLSALTGPWTSSNCRLGGVLSIAR